MVVAGWARSFEADLTAELQVSASLATHARGADGSAVRRITVRGQAARPGAAMATGARSRAGDDPSRRLLHTRHPRARMGAPHASGPRTCSAPSPPPREPMRGSTQLGMASRRVVLRGRHLPPAGSSHSPAPPPASGAVDPRRGGGALPVVLAQCHRTRDAFRQFPYRTAGRVRAKLPQCADGSSSA